ncbi:hypothetical protein ACFOGG_00300 [Brenneria rubrifaciens]
MVTLNSPPQRQSDLFPWLAELPEERELMGQPEERAYAVLP